MFFLDSMVMEISKSLNTPYDQINLMVCLFLSFPLGYLNRFIKNATLRLLFGLITGFYLQMQMYGDKIIHIFIATCNTYLFIIFFGRKFSAFYVLVFNILHLSFIHIRRMMDTYGGWSIDIDALYMLSICKFSSIAFSYEDGAKNDEEIKSNYLKSKTLKEKPSLLEVFAFIYYFPSSLIGPSFEFQDFIKFIRLEDEYKDINYQQCTKSSLKDLSLAIFSIIMTILFSNKFPPAYCGTEEFVSLPLWYKYFYFMFSMFIVRCKYYSGWQTSQAGITFCGLNYYSIKNKETNQTEFKFDKILCCSVWDIEFNISTKTRIQYWNRTVHLWLKYHIFLRLISGKKRLSTSIASLITFMISAIWHGFYPVYYLFFLFYYLIEQVATEIEQKGLVTYIEKAPFWQRLLYRIFLSSFLQFFGQCFPILRLSHNMNFFRAFYFVPNIILISLYIYFCLLKRKSKNKSSTEQNASSLPNKEN